MIFAVRNHSTPFSALIQGAAFLTGGEVGTDTGNPNADLSNGLATRQ